MSDDALRALAAEAGLQPRWTDNTGADRDVSADTLRATLAALGLPAATDHDVRESRARAADEKAVAAAPPLVVARAGAGIEPIGGIAAGAHVRIEFEQGGAVEHLAGEDGRLPPVEPIGYHRLIAGDREIGLAIAPTSAITACEIGAGVLLWGLAAQIYGLRSKGDGGLGHFGAVATLAEAAARDGADCLALSPTHAQFLADENHFTPYSPSSRLFYNVLFSDPAMIFGPQRVAAVGAAQVAAAEAADLVDWPTASAARVKSLRALYDDFRATDLAASTSLAADFLRFRAAGGAALEAHAAFEALHAREYGRDFTKWNWRDWAPELRDAGSQAVAEFTRENVEEIGFHVFAQWLADRSMGCAQERARAAGMRIGLVSDLAVGMNAGGSHGWSRPDDLLLGLSIGAPPDMLAPLGQNWGLTTFSPRALKASGYAPFLATLRAALRNAGGVRIDHVMGLVRLWLVPEGAEATDGVYLDYPIDDLIALTCLESQRHRAIVIGEDLGTVPYGLRDRLSAAGLAGMRVFQFERDGERFHPPDWYTPSAVAMTGTHDTATIAGWWQGRDIAARAELGHLGPGRTRESADAERAHERAMAWRAFCEAGAAGGDQPAPENPTPAVDAAALFIASTPAALAILPLEDALGRPDQPNLPGTTTEYPNWRRRYPGETQDLLEQPGVAGRLRRFDGRRKRRN